MGKWEMVRLGDVCEIVSGSTPSTHNLELWDGDIKWIAPAEISDNSYFIYDTVKHISEKAGLRPMPAGTVLLSSRAPIGKVAIAGIEMCCNQGFKNLICSDNIHNRYLYRYLKNQTEYLNSLGRGATFKEISKAIVEDVTIPLPPLPVQKQISDMLDCANALIEKRKAQIEKLNLLIKSKFTEMFGDPKKNSFHWMKAKMGDYLTVLTDFSANGSYEYLDSNVVMYDEPDYALMIRTTDLESQDFENDVKYIDENAYEILEKSKLYGGEIIMNKIGSAGKVYLMPTLKCPASLGRNAFMFRYKEDINIKFVYFLLTSKYGEKEIMQHVRGAVTKTITKDAVRSIQIIVPPISRQNEFATFVEQVESQKYLLKQSLEKLELNYKSLMQKCFRGDIF